MLKKAKLYSLLAIIVASTVAGLIVPSVPVSAQADTTDSGLPSLYIDPEFEKDVNAKNLREAILLCLRYNPNPVSPADLSNGKWFINDGIKPSPGYLTDREDGYYSCTEGENGSMLVNEFLKSYPKLGSRFTAACTLGYLPSSLYDAEPGTENKQACLDSDGVETTGYSFYGQNGTTMEAAREAINGGRNWATDHLGMGDVQLYILYMRTFQLACSPSDPKIESQLNPGDRNTHTMVTVVDGKGKPTDVYFIVPDLTSNKKVRVASVEGNSNENKNCQEIANAVNQYAPAYATYIEGAGLTDTQIKTGSQDLLGTDIPGGDSESGTSSCRVDGIGWIICPVVTLMAEMVDSSYHLLDNSLLRTPAISLDTEAPLYTAWKLMRDFANVAFVLIFMFIIFSQITSFGISNYGIKQLLPKLIIAAILVNLSYLICALAVDASNIFGSQLKGFFDDLAGGIDTGGGSGPFEWKEADNGDGTKTSVVGWVAISGSILIAAGLGGGVLAILALLIPFLFAALGAVIATVVTLIIRQALIIILIFIAPLAFVALLLPNTESYFKSWRKLFQSLLLLYPVIAIVFGGSALASRVIMSAAEASTHGDPLGDGLGGATQTLLQLSGAAVSVIPLFLVPTVIKVAGGALNRFAGIVNNPNKGPIDWARNRSMKGIERKQKNLATKAFDTGRRTGVRGRAKDLVSGRSKYHRQADMKREDADRDRELALQEANYGAEQVKKNINPSTANDRQMRELAGAISTQEELKTKELRAATLIIEDENFSGEDRQQLALEGFIQKPQLDANGNIQKDEKGEVIMGPKQFQSETMQKAAAIMQFTTGSAAEKMAIAEATAITEEGAGSLAKYSAEIAQAAAKTGFPGAAPQAAGKGIDDIAQNKFDFKQRTMEGLDEGRFTSESVAGMNDKIFNRTVKTVDSEIAEIAEAKNKGVNTQEEKEALEAREVIAIKAHNTLRQAAQGIRDKDNLDGKIKGNKLMEGLVDDLRTRPELTQIGPATISVASPGSPAGNTQPVPQQSSPQSNPTPPQQPTPTPSAPTVNSGRQRDWSGYGQPADTGLPTQTESPTFTPGQPSTPATPTPSASSGGRQRDWSGYDSGSSATAEAVEKVAKELRGVANKLGENDGGASATGVPTPSTPPTPVTTPSSINSGRQRDWSGYSTPPNADTPSQTESPTFKPSSNDSR